MDPLEQLTASIGKAEALALWPHLKVRRFVPGEVMFREGVPSNHLYFLTEGTLNASVGAGDGAVSLGVLRPGAWLGEIGFIDKGSATATVIAGEPAIALSISHGELMTLSDSDPHAAAVLLRTITRQLAERLRSSTAGIVEQVAEGRYRLKNFEENRGWLERTLGWLLGSGGGHA